MTEDLDVRLRRLLASDDADALIDLGCDLADAGRQADAEACFRRAFDLGDSVAAYNLGNSLAAQDRWEEAVDAYEIALRGGEADAWRNLGLVLEDLGDLAGAMRAYRGAAAAGDLEGGLQLAFLLRDQGEREQAMAVAEEFAAAGDEEAAAVVACWRWCSSLDPSLEADLRAGQHHFPAARADLAHLLRETGRSAEARSVLERGAKLGEQVAWLPLGNLYREELGDEEAAEEAYRSGIAAGDPYCHQNLAVLLADRGDLEGAVEQFRLGAAAGDQLAAQCLQELERD
ncbi:tetratricopeptide repeat protein [Blastococcus saxobsidens]|uniref:Tetratricopeptide repeat protein n=1 Tax=Blastococcus saxobsidens TaxID=138336 RepID=A0A4Q7YDI5_9ACTN|nr:tetratricopeptide repeat protein [Blastococcus saxobsidens]RZU34401.1 tetratricopeptide repeat protein [Blastococcus saxobsidens]